MRRRKPRSPGFIKLIRSEPTEALVQDHPRAFALLTFIAYRAQRTERANRYNLEPRQAVIGTWDTVGMTRGQFRSAVKHLEATGHILVNPGPRGTVFTLLTTSVFDINAELNQGQFATSLQPPRDQQTTSRINGTRKCSPVNNDGPSRIVFAAENCGSATTSQPARDLCATTSEKCSRIQEGERTVERPSARRSRERAEESQSFPKSLSENRRGREGTVARSRSQPFQFPQNFEEVLKFAEDLMAGRYTADADPETAARRWLYWNRKNGWEKVTSWRPSMRRFVRRALDKNVGTGFSDVPQNWEPEFPIIAKESATRILEAPDLAPDR